MSSSPLDLPWTPWYTQSGGGSVGGDDDAGTAALSALAYASLAATVGFTLFVYSMESFLDLRQRMSYQKTAFPKELEVTVSVIDKEREIKRKELLQKKKDDENDSKSNEKKTSGEDGKKHEDGEKKKDEGEKKDEEKKKDEEDDLKPLLPQLQSKFRNAQTYGMDKINFGMIASLYDTVESVVFLLGGFLPYIWDKSADLGNSYFEWNEADNEIKISLIFLLLTTLIGTVTSLPFEVYSTFQIERKHGFNKQTPGLFVTDKIKSLLLTFVIGGPFVALLLYIIQMGGERFYLYVWAFMFVFSVFMMTIVPVFIMPLFNKYEPLPDGTLKKRIYELAERLKYPLTKLFVMDGSKRSSHSNAFMFGFGNNKRIVLFDTLVEQVHEDEILAILGHELGHWKLGHTLSNFVVTQLYSGAAFYFFSVAYTSHDLYKAFGFDDDSRPIPTIIALLLFFQTLWAPVDKILSFVLTVFSRHNEFAADKFSVDLGMSRKLQSGLCKIHLENLGAMCPDPWYSTYHYSHPPLVERLSAMMKLDAEQKESKKKAD